MKTKEMIAKNKQEGQIMIYTCPICKKKFMVQDEKDIGFTITHLLETHEIEEIARWVPWAVDIVKLSSLQSNPRPPDKRYKSKSKSTDK